MRDFLCFAINEFGDGQHPMADEESLPHFVDDYVTKCVRKAVASGKIDDHAVELANEWLAGR